MNNILRLLKITKNSKLTLIYLQLKYNKKPLPRQELSNGGYLAQRKPMFAVARDDEVDRFKANAPAPEPSAQHPPRRKPLLAAVQP